MTKGEIEQWLSMKGIDKDQRIDMPNGGISLINLLAKLEWDARLKTIGEVRRGLKKFTNGI